MRRIFYDPITGRGIYSSCQLKEFYPDWVDCDDDIEKTYFPGGVPTPKVKMTPTITGNDPAVVDSAVSFTGFPDDAVVTIDGIEYQLDDGEINFTPTSPGSYRVQAFHVAYLNYGVAIHAS